MAAHRTATRFLLVSLGSIGRRHLANLRALRPDARIGVLRLQAGPDAPLPQGADLQFHALAQALEFAPDAAIVASPASRHAEVALPLLRAGVPVLAEKPLADSAAQGEAMVACARASGALLMTAYNLRFLPLLREVRRLLQGDTLGEVLSVRGEVGQYLPDWRPGTRYQEAVSAQRALGGGALLELSHELDFLGWVFGPPRRVTATGGRYSGLEIDVEDLAEVTLAYEQPRRLVQLRLDLLQRVPSRTGQAIGSQGTLRWDVIANTLGLFRADGAGWQALQVPALPDRNATYVEELRHFLRAVEEGAPCEVDGAQGLAALRIVEAARRSMAQGRTVELAA
ncbi:Gfo/Idh/MocA family oxidoreductase [Ramlibacter sp. PS3R-8]|uniref:Gfo/Idh/MocA family protein n=1 Tax=Ramlibacter sp. PS3R-8 TaxID=3133437 RepID=UPI0030AB4DD6